MGIDQLSERCRGCDAIKPWGTRCMNCMSKASEAAVLARMRLHHAGVAFTETQGAGYERERTTILRAKELVSPPGLAALERLAQPPPQHRGVQVPVELPDGTFRMYDLRRAEAYEETLGRLHKLLHKDALMLARWAASMPEEAVYRCDDYPAWKEAFHEARRRAEVTRQYGLDTKAAWDKAFDEEMAEDRQRRELRRRLVAR